MIQVADQLGIHVATVSRAVSEKWIQTPRGVFPLRRFFSGGTTNAEGEDMSWDAVKEKLKDDHREEDTTNPLNDDEIVEKLKEQGIDLARRTVAKYRKDFEYPHRAAAEEVLEQLKILNRDGHRRFCGRSNGLAEDSFGLLESLFHFWIAHFAVAGD